MGLRTIDHTTSKKDFVPGPGQYTTDDYKHISKIKNEPSFSMGTGLR